jgi:hypothetical protein
VQKQELLVIRSDHDTLGLRFQRPASVSGAERFLAVLG